MRGAFALLMIIGTAGMASPADLSGREGAYRYYVAGNPQDVVRPTTGLIVLQGGGDDIDENYVRMGARGGGGDFVVLRASGADEYNDYLWDVLSQMKAKGIRVELDESDDRFPKKIRNASKSKVPFILIAGEEDRAAGAVSFRYRDGSQKNGVPVADAVAEVLAAVASRAQV